MGMDAVNVGGYYVTAEEAQALLEDAELEEQAEQEYLDTYQRYGITGREYRDDDSIQHPFPVAFKHFNSTIGLDPDVAHVLSCGENRFDLIDSDMDNSKRVLATKFYDYLVTSGYWAIAEIIEYDSGCDNLEPAAFNFLETLWKDDEYHPLYELLNQNQRSH